MKVERLLLSCIFLSAASHVHAVEIELYDWVYNVDGITSEAYFGDPIPGTSNLDNNGLGTVSFDFTEAGSHSVYAFLDYQLVGPTSSFYDEYGEAHGSAVSGQSWEIDDPYYGDILLDNTFDGTFDNSNSVPQGLESDVALGMGWNIDLAAGETAQVTFTASDILDANDFYLAQVDPATDTSLYLWSSLEIISSSGNSVGVPEPGTAVLLFVGIAALGGFTPRRRRRPSSRAPRLDG